MAGAVTLAAPAPLVVVTNNVTLEEAIRLALANNPSLRASSARAEASLGRVEQARKWPNPELEIKTEEWPITRGRGFSDAKHTLAIAQTLPYPGKKSLDQQVAGAEVKLSETELALRRTELVRDVKIGFYRVLALERLLGVSTQLLAVAEASAATAQRRVEAGAAAYQEQLRAEVQLEQATAEVGEFQREWAMARQRLATLLGHPELKDATFTGTLAEVADDLALTPEDPAWLARHPSTAAAQTHLDRARLAHRRTRLEPYPDIKLALGGGRIGESDHGIIELGISFPLPLIDRGRGKQQEALAQVKMAEAELHHVQQLLQQELANALKRYRTAAAQVARHRERLLPKAEEALRLVQNGFEEGKFNFMDLLDTQRTAAEARLAYWQKLLELNVARAELEALLQPQPILPSLSDKSL
ncbi:TolC family protein [Fontisphaera persica]|uniref:TolC family protein n=1 Tax=Fontisphaera persica TaxID=2974023 RepID=UPI0024C04523|nr:TolC family protein [Fontisphaera persica]WCJ59895.1 TolC family protein [Fontisphaera persica]